MDALQRGFTDADTARNANAIGASVNLDFHGDRQAPSCHNGENKSIIKPDLGNAALIPALS